MFASFYVCFLSESEAVRWLVRSDVYPILSTFPISLSVNYYDLSLTRPKMKLPEGGFPALNSLNGMCFSLGLNDLNILLARALKVRRRKTVQEHSGRKENVGRFCHPLVVVLTWNVIIQEGHAQNSGKMFRRDDQGDRLVVHFTTVLNLVPPQGGRSASYRRTT